MSPNCNKWGCLMNLATAMKSPVVKRSIVVAGHKTSVSLEDEFWKGLKEIAGARELYREAESGQSEHEKQCSLHYAAIHNGNGISASDILHAYSTTRLPPSCSALRITFGGGEFR